MSATTRAVTTRYNTDWVLQDDLTSTGNEHYHRRLQIILLQEIRDELKAINATLACRNTLDIPVRLRAIERAVKKLPSALKDGVR